MKNLYTNEIPEIPPPKKPPAIFFTGPAFTAILAWLTLNEPISILDILATLACMSGVGEFTKESISPHFLPRNQKIPW